MSAATAIARSRRQAAPCLPHKSSRAVKRPSRPTPQGTARVLTAELKAMEWALIQFLRHSSVCLYLKTEVPKSAASITTWVAITPIDRREHRRSTRTL
jgi:hypothetical protein